MGIRGIDIQVAIQRAAEADKIQQADTANARAGEAGSREEAEALRARKQEQPRETEKSDQVIIQRRKEKEEKDREEKKKEENLELEEEELRKPRVQGSLNIKI